MATPTEILVTRHGEARCNVEQFIGGQQGCRGLTPDGRLQVELLATRLAAEPPITALYASSLRRTTESADIIGADLGLPPTVEPLLREQDHGQADGQPWDRIVTGFGGIPALEPDRALADGGETWNQYFRRSSRALNQIVARHQGQKVLIVGHGETIDISFRMFLGATIADRGRIVFAAYPASITRWIQQPVSWTRPDAGIRWMLATHNDTAHLATGTMAA